MKKILICLMSVVLIGCAQPPHAGASPHWDKLGRFKYIEGYKDNQYEAYYLYDKESKIVYYYIKVKESGMMLTPLYKSNGEFLKYE